MTLSQKHLAGFIWFRTVLNALSRHLELSLCTEVWSLPSRVPGRESPSLELDWKSTHFQLHDLWIECCMLSKFLVHLQKAPQNFRSHSHICCTSSANSIQPITMKAVPLWGGWSLVDLSSWKASLSFGQLSRDMPGRPSHSVRSCFSWEGRETSVVLNWHEATIVYIMCIYLYTIQISFIFYCGLYKNTRNVFQLAASFCMFFLALGSPQGVLRSKATANCKSFRPEFASGDPGARWTWTRLSL